MTLTDEIRKMPAKKLAALGLSPEVLLALTSTDKERMANAEAALAMLREGRELTPAIIRQLAADHAVAKMERAEIRRLILDADAGLAAARQRLLDTLCAPTHQLLSILGAR
jgi:hypothetical protein